MQRLTPRSVTALLLCAVLSFASPYGEAAKPARSSAEAVVIVQRDTGGRVLGVSAVDRGYIVKVLMPDGVVRTVFVPAAGN